jgi:hypothetical protein
VSGQREQACDRDAIRWWLLLQHHFSAFDLSFFSVNREDNELSFDRFFAFASDVYTLFFISLHVFWSSRSFEI